MNDLRQRGEHGRRGGIRPSHVLMQLVGAFVAVFYGLNRAWSYFNTLFLFADTVRSVSRKLYNAMSQNGRTGSRAAGQQTPPAEEEDEDDASDDDEGETETRGKTIGALTIQDKAVSGFRLAEWAACKQTTVVLTTWTTTSLLPEATTVATMPAGATAILLEHSEVHRPSYFAMAQTVQRMGGEALVIAAETAFLESRDTGLEARWFPSGAVSQ